MLTIPAAAWDHLLDLFAMTPSGVERVAYLDGVLVTTKAGVRGGVVTTVTIPDALLTPGFYRVEGDAITAASTHLFGHGLRRLAQVHTHGNGDTSHSPTDDDMAYSKAPGAISIVLPFHAAGRPTPTDGTVHIRRDDCWLALDRSGAEQEVRVVPSTVDLRALASLLRAGSRSPWWSPKRWTSSLPFRRHR